MTPPPLTLGTAGHIDHGKTALVRRLTGIDTDRLPEERARGISITLGYAKLELPSGRSLSVVDVPGHERFVRTMVAGATGVDMFLMVIAADDGVMPQTREHALVLHVLGVTDGVVAVTKSDTADPARAIAQASELVPGVPIVPCSSKTGEGLGAVEDALDAVASRLPGRAHDDEPPVLHVDRVFTIRGAGTVVTGTLWSGAVARGDSLAIQPRGARARVRAVHVHDVAVERATAGQRVALNLAGMALADVGRGDVVCDPERGPRPTHRLDVALQLMAEPAPRVHVHHGTRDAPARLVTLGGEFWQARLEQPLIAAPGDRLVIRSIAPHDTLGGGVVVDAEPRRHGAAPAVRSRLEALRVGAPVIDAGTDESRTPRMPETTRSSVQLSATAIELEARLRAAGHEPPEESELAGSAGELSALRAAGRAVRIGRSMYAHPDAMAEVKRRVEAIITAEGGITVARLRDELRTSRKYAQALLENLDATRLTLRLPDGRRVLRRRSGRSP